jgi:Cu(I)/Ag(I) efflux system membrane fusion protein
VVYVSVPDAPEPTYEAREVVLGPRAGGFYIVREGLGEGERVVVDGAFRIDSAMQIAAKPSMMSPGRGDRREGRGGSEPIAGLEGFVADLEPVYAAYFRAQEALADDDLGGFGVAADELRLALGRVGEVALTGGALGDWRRAAAKLRVESESTSIDAARERFETMSEGIVSLERRFGHLGDQTWRLAHCPMAFDFKGADWLQRGEVIDNPYFGASMLRCGEIRGTFQPLGGDAVRGEGHDHD